MKQTKEIKIGGIKVGLGFQQGFEQGKAQAIKQVLEIIDYKINNYKSPKIKYIFKQLKQKLEKL